MNNISITKKKGETMNISTASRIYSALKELAAAISELAGETMMEQMPSDISDAEPLTLSLDDMKTAFAKKAQEGFKSQIKELMQKYGASKVSEIKPDDYQNILKELNNINGGF